MWGVWWLSWLVLGIMCLRDFSSLSFQNNKPFLCHFLFVLNVIGYCTDICCDPLTEETCYSQNTGQPESCSSFADGGCPCPHGQFKCGVMEGYPGMLQFFSCPTFLHRRFDLIRGCQITLDLNPFYIIS